MINRYNVSGQSSTIAFAVEVRSAFDLPSVHDTSHQIMDGQWRRVPIEMLQDGNAPCFKAGDLGNLPVTISDPQAINLGLMDFESAYTVACHYLAQAKFAACIECRLVKVKVISSYTAEVASFGEPIALTGIKSNMKFETPEAK